MPFPVLALRLGLLAAASVSDLATHKVSNWFPFVLWLTGFHSPGSLGSLLRRLAAMLAVFTVLYIWYRVFPGKCPGGADIKMVTALAFVLGKGFLPFLVYLLGLCLLCICILLLFRKKEVLRARVAFVPWMTAAVWLYYII